MYETTLILTNVLWPVFNFSSLTSKQCKTFEHKSKSSVTPTSTHFLFSFLSILVNSYFTFSFFQYGFSPHSRLWRFDLTCRRLTFLIQNITCMIWCLESIMIVCSRWSKPAEILTSSKTKPFLFSNSQFFPSFFEIARPICQLQFLFILRLTHTTNIFIVSNSYYHLCSVATFIAWTHLPFNRAFHPTFWLTAYNE